MMKYFVGILVAIFALVSCKSDDDSLQRIDQVLNIYMKNAAGQDLLNQKKPGSYTGYAVNDIFGTRDISPVTIPLRMTADSLFYMEYLAGAKRRRMDSISPDNPGTGNSYFSRMQITFTKSTNVNDNVTGILEVQYRNTPTLFQVSKVLYDGTEVFSKNADAPTSINTFTITK
ncbi:hypothetical protein EGY07_22030 [Chryseobacterium indologenes]|uniref:Uncharacterized protein n=2 Tax=Chryseobacterium indologenes TaxID=253 RepID=A0AAD1DWY2_CHRID|nr:MULTISPECIES: hypothetical protein [Chryseobacterium]ASE63066.1 hypothetical protein CEQ15_17005 [Chryseobacterium indologenes]ATN06974.1 hypothetical protein CRN76_16955 [Chryseobacterium indologenes]AYY84280.1 hypothetical protein EGX91_06840 [Chryseobacterium indologenes]AYZ38023.1 hypothetical protein EGY07_22030 [Chryseobacterium indologenes]AZB18762.1 hypothetical protein EG352_13725 [Chryseobacterium indologenes]